MLRQQHLAAQQQLEQEQHQQSLQYAAQHSSKIGSSGAVVGGGAFGAGIGGYSVGARGGGMDQVGNVVGGSSVGARSVAEANNPETAAHVVKMKQMLQHFWQTQNKEMEALEVGTEQDFKNHNDLPLARIKRIMKSDEDVRMISAEAPVLFAKACEMFILELTLRSWCYSEQNKRRTLQKEDIQTAIRKTESTCRYLNLSSASFCYDTDFLTLFFFRFAVLFLLLVTTSL